MEANGAGSVVERIASKATPVARRLAPVSWSDEVRGVGIVFSLAFTLAFTTLLAFTTFSTPPTYGLLPV